MYPIDFIYTPPEITARAIKKEFDKPKVGNGVVTDKKTKTKFLLIWIGVMTSPIWVLATMLILANLFFGA